MKPADLPRCIRMLIALFPARIRDRDRREIETITTDLCREAASRSGWARRTLFRCRIATDLIVGAAIEWAEKLSPAESAPPTGRREMTHLLDDLRRDVGYAGRTLLKTPGFLLGTLSLALTIGATTAVYSTADWLLHKPMGGVVNPEELVTLLQYDDRKSDLGPFGFSFEQVHQFGDVQDGFSSWAAYGKVARILTDDRGADEVVFENVTGEFFATLGARPELGRLFGREDDRGGGPLVAVISHHLWQSRYGGDPQVLGRSIRVSGHDAQVVGVLSSDFEDASLDWNGPAEVWMPMDPAQENGLGVSTTGTFYPIIGRLKPEVTRDLVQSRSQAWLPELSPIKTQFYEINRVKSTPTADTRIRQRDQAGQFLNSLLVVCVLIMLAACFNLANIFLGRAVTRGRELALRSSLGASRGRLLQQLVTESLLVGACASAVGVAAGIGLAWLMAPLPKVYLTVAAQTAPITTTAAVSRTLLGTAVTLGFATCLVFGLLPALVGLRRAHVSVLKQPTPSWSWAGLRLNLRQGALALQVALSVALAITAGLYARSFARVASTDAGYVSPDSLLIARLVVPIARDDRAAFYAEFLGRVRKQPGVLAASLGGPDPFMQAVFPLSSPEGNTTDVGFYSIFPRFFEAERVSILKGREFEETEPDPDVIVVNEELAEALWPGKEPLGETLLYNGVEKRVVGVVRYPHCQSPIGEGLPCLWQPLAPTAAAVYARIRVQRDGLAFAPRLRDLVREISPEVAVTQVNTFQEIVLRRTASQRTAAAISSALGIFCLILLGVGAATLFVSMVRESLREIAIRMALGARHGRIIRRVMGQGLAVTAAGVLTGILGAYFLAPHLETQLYRTDATDPLTFIAAPLFVALVGTAAVAYASIIAVRTDPSRHLQAE